MRIVKVVVEGLNGRFRAQVAEAIDSCGSIEIQLLGDWRCNGPNVKTIIWTELVDDRSIAIGCVFW